MYLFLLIDELFGTLLYKLNKVTVASTLEYNNLINAEYVDSLCQKVQKKDLKTEYTANSYTIKSLKDLQQYGFEIKSKYTKKKNYCIMQIYC